MLPWRFLSPWLRIARISWLETQLLDGLRCSKSMVVMAHLYESCMNHVIRRRSFLDTVFLVLWGILSRPVESSKPTSVIHWSIGGCFLFVSRSLIAWRQKAVRFNWGKKCFTSSVRRTGDIKSLKFSSFHQTSPNSAFRVRNIFHD